MNARLVLYLADVRYVTALYDLRIVYCSRMFPRRAEFPVRRSPDSLHTMYYWTEPGSLSLFAFRLVPRESRNQYQLFSIEGGRDEVLGMLHYDGRSQTLG